MKPKVSVLVLAYNQESTIRRTLDSIISQKTQYEFEVIIGDDASSDTTRLVCQEYSDKYNNVYLVEEAPNKGVVVNYRDCLRKARGQYIMGCAGDDWWHENKIQDQVNYMEDHINCSLLFGGCTMYNITTGVKTHSQPAIGLYTLESLLLHNPIAALTMCIRFSSDMFEVLKATIDNHWGMEDLPMILYMASKGEVHCIKGDFATYCIQSGSISNASTLEKKEHFERQVLEIRQYFKKELKINSINDSDILDKYYISLSTNGIRYNNRMYCLNALKDIKRKRVTDYVKIIICQLPFGFTILRNYLKSIIVN